MIPCKANAAATVGGSDYSSAADNAGVIPETHACVIGSTKQCSHCWRDCSSLVPRPLPASL
ncbi:hypothetical protein PIB30_069233, partial [Stylosanthes scabra]|nr:hypothetical protein [Stylosanthes scabra]